MNDQGILPVITLISIPSESNTDHRSFDFVQVFPPELSNKLFAYVTEKDLFSCLKCSISWQRVINNNPQWKLRCIKRGWATSLSDNSVAQKWNAIKSHVNKNELYKFRTSPAFFLPEIASLRITPLCEWAVYFRQCLHLQRNWNEGIYVIHRLTDLGCNKGWEEYMILNNDFDCNGKLLVVGASSGKVLLWSVEGLPNFVTSISLRKRIEVESVTLTSSNLIVLYQTGLIKVFDTSGLLDKNDGELTLVYQIRAIGLHSPNGLEFSLNAELIVEDEVDDIAQEEGENNDVETWIRDLFRIDLWIGSEYMGTDMMIYSNEEIVLLTGILCKCFYYWNIRSGSSIRKISLPPGHQVVYQSHLTPRKLYLPTKRRMENAEEFSTSNLLVYDISELKREHDASEIINPLVISTDSIVEEVRANSQDTRIVYATQDGILYSIHFLEDNKYETLFTIYATSFVDNLTVTDEVIVYHQYDGYLVGIDWAGNQLYEIEAHTGLVKGLQIVGDKLISGGDCRQLSIWKVETGERLHTVYHQPCRIQHLFVDETKIVTVGREDAPVVIAYW